MMRAALVSVVVLAVPHAAAAATARHQAIAEAELLAGAALTFPDDEPLPRVPARAEVFELRALRLKHEEPEFHALRGRVLEALDRPRDAAQSFGNALEYAELEREQQRSRIVFDALAVR